MEKLSIMQRIESALKKAIVHIPKACRVSVYVYIF
jgi:hypothetical protein